MNTPPSNSSPLVLHLAAQLLLLCLCTAVVHAQDKVEVEVSDTVLEMGQSLEYTVLAASVGNKEIRLKKEPDYQGFALVGRAQMPQIMFRDGQTIRQIRLTYSLKPRQVGSFTIDPPTLLIGDVSFTPEAMTIKVVAQGQGPAPKVVKQKGISVGAKVRPERSPYVGEQVMLEYDLYVDSSMMGVRPSHPSEPSLDAFWIEEVDADQMGAKHLVRLGATFYEKIQLRRYALFPLRAGVATIEPMSVDVTTGGFLSRTKRVTIQSDPIKLQVKPLPEGAPAGFGPGNVGQWKFLVTTDALRAAVGGSITVRVSLEGQGQPGRLEVPEFGEIEGFKIAHIDQNITSEVKDRVVTGTHTMTYTLVPLKEGAFDLPPLSFSYFDPEQAAYKTLESSSIRLDITPGALPPEVIEPPRPEPVSRKEASEAEIFASLRGDLRPPKRHLDPAHDKASPFATTLWFKGLIALGLLVLGWQLFGTFARSLLTRDTPGRRQKLAKKAALLALEQAEGHEGIVAVLRDFLTQGLGLASGHVTATEVAGKLEALGIPAPKAAKVAQVLKKSQRARFSSASMSPQDVADLKEEVTALIAALAQTRGGSPAAAPTTLMVLGLGTALLPLLLVCGTSGGAWAGEPPPHDVALKAYEARDWAQAAAQWDRALDVQPNHPGLMHNRALAALALEDFGSARLWLERAFTLAPHDRDVATNLGLVTRMIRVRTIEHTRGRAGVVSAEDGLFWWDVARRTTANTLGLGVVLSVWALCAMIWWRRRASQPAVRDTLFVVSLLVGLIALGSGLGWAGRAHVMQRITPGVVRVDGAILRDGPSAHAAQRRATQPLIQGTRVPIEGQRKGWFKIRLADGTPGWIEGAQITPVE